MEVAWQGREQGHICRSVSQGLLNLELVDVNLEIVDVSRTLYVIKQMLHFDQ